MKLNLIQEPFPHIIIENFYDEKEYPLIWNELIFLAPKMKLPHETAAAKDERGPIKQGKGIQLDNFFSNQEYSDILMYTRKVIGDGVKKESKKLGLYFELYHCVNKGTLIAQLYRNGDYYLPHKDMFVFSVVILLYKTPKKYEGGELIFPEYDYNPKLANNNAIIFPSIISHEVTEVISNSKLLEDSRFSITQFLTI